MVDVPLVHTGFDRSSRPESQTVLPFELLRPVTGRGFVHTRINHARSAKPDHLRHVRECSGRLVALSFDRLDVAAKHQRRGVGQLEHLESLAAGLSVADIVDAYPSLTEESARGALTELARAHELQAA